MPKIIDEDKLFAAVVGVLVAKGYENATTKDLAAAAGVHEATLFRKYGSKVNLVALAIEQQMSVVPLAHLHYTGDLEADLLSIVEAYIETNRTHGAILPMIFIELPRRPELAEVLHRPMANIDGILKIIQQYQAQGQLKQEPPYYTLLALIGWLFSYFMVIRAMPDYPVPPIAPQEHVAAFLNGRRA